MSNWLISCGNLLLIFSLSLDYHWWQKYDLAIPSAVIADCDECHRNVTFIKLFPQMKTLPDLVNSPSSRPQINKDRLLFHRSSSGERVKASHSHRTTFEGLRGQQKSRYVKKTEPTSISEIGIAYLPVFKNDDKAAFGFLLWLRLFQ